VIKKLANVPRALGRETPIRVGHLRSKDALGEYYPRSDINRLRRANDTYTAWHEMGHAIQRWMFGAISYHNKFWQSSGIPHAVYRELTALGKALYGKKKPAHGGYSSEGFAEFLRLWGQDSPYIQENAKATLKWFEENILEPQPKLRAALEKAREVQIGYSQGEALEVMKKSIVDTASPASRLGRLVQDVTGIDIEQTMIDMAAPLSRMVSYAEQQGVDVPLAFDPFAGAVALRSSHAARLKYMVENGMINFDATLRRGVRPLTEASALIKGKYKDFAAYLYARRALALLMDPQGARDPGVTFERAAYVKNKLESPEFARAADIFYKWQDGILDYASQASPMMATLVERIRARDPGDYVPLWRDIENIAFRAFGSSVNPRTVSNATFLKRLRGSGELIKDPIQSVIANAENWIRASHQRYVLDRVIAMSRFPGMGAYVFELSPKDVPRLSRSVVRALDDIKRVLKNAMTQGDNVLAEIYGAAVSGTEDVRKIVRLADKYSEEQLGEMAALAVTFFGKPSMVRGRDSYVLPYYDGKEIRWFEVREDIVSSLGTLDVYRLPKWGPFPILEWVLGKPASTFRLGTTGARAAFSLGTNSTRDAQTMIMNSRAKQNGWLMLFNWMGTMTEAGYGSISGHTSGWAEQLSGRRAIRVDNVNVYAPDEIEVVQQQLQEAADAGNRDNRDRPGQRPYRVEVNDTVLRYYTPGASYTLEFWEEDEVRTGIHRVVKTPAKGEPETLFSPTNQHKNWYDFFQRTGIGMAQALSQDTPHTRRAARRVTQRTGWRYVDVRNWFDFYRDVLQFPEEAARLAEVKAVAADRGVKFPERTDVQSMIALMIAGKTVTADFSGGGEWARVINRMVPFFTASIKGPQASLSALQRDPRKFIQRALTMYTLPSLYLWWKYKDEDWWLEADEIEKYLYSMFPVQIDGLTEIVRIPRAHEIGGMFAALPVAIADSIYRWDPEGIKQWWDTFVNVQAPNPFAIHSLKLGAEQLQNYMYFWQRRIVPRSEEERVGPEQYNDYTTRASIWLADLAARVSGTGEDGLPRVRLSPYRLDHAMRGIGGQALVDLLDWVQLGRQKPNHERTMSDWPIAGVFFRRGGDVGARPKSIQKIYDRMEFHATRQASKRNPETAEERNQRLIIEDAIRAISSLQEIRSVTYEEAIRRELLKEATSIARDALAESEQPTPLRVQKYQQLGNRMELREKRALQRQQ
jgi:hypothetical protein